MTYIFLSRHTLFQNVVHSSILSSLCIAPIYILISFSFSPLFSSLFPFSLLTYTPQTYYISHIFMISYPSLHLSFLPHLSLSFSSIFQSLTQFFYFYKSLFLSLNSTYLFISSSLSLFISPSLTLSLSHSLTFSLLSHSLSPTSSQFFRCLHTPLPRFVTFISTNPWQRQKKFCHWKKSKDLSSQCHIAFAIESYKRFLIVNYDFRVVLTRKLSVESSIVES